MTPRAAVLGYPVAHSLSPLIHGYWLERAGLDGTYEKIAVPPPDLARVLDRLEREGYAGVNCTIPLKEEAFALLDARPDRDRVTPAARAVKAVNTLTFPRPRAATEASEGRRGDNTDGFGFSAWLRASLADRGRAWEDLRAGPTVLLGAGGAARGVSLALADHGFSDVRIVNRTLSRARALASERGPAFSAAALDQPLPPQTTLLVNATSTGLDGRPDAPVDLSGMASTGVVYDLVYKPLETGLLRAARTRGLTTVDGLGMLIWQAVPAFEAFFGLRPIPDAELFRRCREQLS